MCNGYGFRELADFLTENYYLKYGDYVYIQALDDVPFERGNDCDRSNLFFVTNGNGHKLELLSVTDSKKIRTIDLSQTSEIVFVLALPDCIKKSIGRP